MDANVLVLFIVIVCCLRRPCVQPELILQHPLFFYEWSAAKTQIHKHNTSAQHTTSNAAHRAYSTSDKMPIAFISRGGNKNAPEFHLSTRMKKSIDHFGKYFGHNSIRAMWNNAHLATRPLGGVTEYNLILIPMAASHRQKIDKTMLLTTCKTAATTTNTHGAIV